MSVEAILAEMMLAIEPDRFEKGFAADFTDERVGHVEVFEASEVVYGDWRVGHSFLNASPLDFEPADGEHKRIQLLLLAGAAEQLAARSFGQQIKVAELDWDVYIPTGITVAILASLDSSVHDEAKLCGTVEEIRRQVELELEVERDNNSQPCKEPPEYRSSGRGRTADISALTPSFVQPKA